MSDFLANLRQQRDERVRDLHLDLPIPTWDGALVARFDVAPRKEVEKFGRQKRTQDADCDFLINHVRCLYALDREKVVDAERMEENEDYVRIEDENGLPVKFDIRLAEKMGVTDATSAREVLQYLVKFNGIAIGGMAAKLIMWMQNTDAEVADSLVGE